MSIQKLRNRFSTGAWIKKISEIYDKVNEIIDNINGTGPVGSGSYKEYIAILTQANTAAPTAIVVSNEFSSTPVYSYSSTGAYLITLSGAFTSNKTIVIPSGTTKGTFGYNFVSTSQIELVTADTSFVQADDILTDVALTIRVYN